MNQMVGSGSGGGGLWNQVSASQVQRRGAGKAMPCSPRFRFGAHLAKTAGLHGAGRTTGGLDGAGRTMGFSKAAAELRGPPGHLKGGAFGGHLCYASNSKPASDALEEPSSSSLRAKRATLATPAVRLQGVQQQSSSYLRAHLAKPAVSRLQGAGMTAHFPKLAVRLEGSRRRMGFGKPAEEVRRSPGHLKGAALGGLLTCYAGSEPPSSFLDDPSGSSLHDKLDVLRRKLDLLHRKLDDVMSTMWSSVFLKWFIQWVFSGVLFVLFVVFAIGTLYNSAGGRSFVEAELNRLIKTTFFTFANDADVIDKLDELVIGRVDNTMYYISSLRTWYKWLYLIWEVRPR